MNKDRNKNKRLGVRFHQTFIPERHYISALLKYVAEDGTGNDFQISEKTGIPTGKSSGKVPAIIKYCLGMGLIYSEGKGNTRVLQLTNFGVNVHKSDPNLGKELTQWMVHLHLCRRRGGAQTWYLCFGPGIEILGKEFSRESLENYLAGFLGRAKRSLIGPMVRTYEDSSALKTAGVLVSNKECVTRKSAPLLEDFRYAYAAFLLQQWEDHFSSERQMTLTDFEEETCWSFIHGWKERQKEHALELIRDTGAIEIDKQMRPWVLIRSKDSDSLWPYLHK